MWIDWIYKCRKSAKDNNLNEYLTGFLVMGNPENKNEIAIMDGILGINLTQLVFANRFKDSATYLSTEISNILEFSITDYDENEFINYVKKYSSGENEITKYFIRSMAGLSFSKRIPKFLKTRMMCKINLSIEGESYFFYRNTKGNICSINEIKKIIQAEISKDI
jgi:hypothetical protein